MKAKVITVHAVHTGGTEIHNGSPTWFFEDLDLAKDTAKGEGSWGGDAHISKLAAIQLENGTCYLIDVRCPEGFELNLGPKTVEERRLAALDKLSSAERKLLGV